MGEDQNDFQSVLINLAEAVDKVENVFKNSKPVIIYELDNATFNSIHSKFKSLKIDENQIKIDISGVEVIFILENSYKPVEKEIKKEVEEPKQKINFWKRLLTFKKGS